MNLLVLYFASGESLYSGAVLLAVAIVAWPLLRSRHAAVLLRLLSWLALIMIVMASSPFTWTAYGVFYLSFVVWHWASKCAAEPKERLKVQVVPSLFLLSILLVLSVSEFVHRAMPRIVGPPADHLVVIGDSISSGIDPLVPAWPAMLQEMTGVPIKNLARPGAQMIEALQMEREINAADRLVLIEIGGNDLLSGVPSQDFASALDALLSKVATPGRIVVMFELPLLPHKIAYGQIQRRLATKYGVRLIPKRYFVGVIRGADATSDGLHLTNAGAHRMAALVARALSSVLKRS
jgi:acyl-CoA thioesterase-1